MHFEGNIPKQKKPSPFANSMKIFEERIPNYSNINQVIDWYSGSYHTND